VTKEVTEKKKKMAEEPKADILGQPLAIGCYVAAPRHSMLKICRVDKISNKMIHLRAIEKTSSRHLDEFMSYPHYVVRLDGPDVMAHILKAK
jgi:hypothetical protein